MGSSYTFVPSTRSWLLPLGIGAILLAVSVAVGLGADHTQFVRSFHVGIIFCLSIALGALFFTMVQHITKSEWSVTLRRIPEVLALAFPFLGGLLVLNLVVFGGMHDIFHWTHENLYVEGSETYDAVLVGKQAYLNLPFFWIRMAVYFASWTYLSWRLYQLSVRQDNDPDPQIPVEQRKVSGWGIPVFGLATAFCGFDLLMSTDPHWFSTMFGVYFFIGSFFVSLAVITMIALFYRRNGLLEKEIGDGQYHDMGKLMFAFTVFWAYIGFSQYMLIWYANLPEETIWFRHRLEHGWETLSAILLVGHFFLPFLLLVARFVKRNVSLLGIMTGWFVVIHFVDIYWIAMPAMTAYDPGAHFSMHWLDFACWIGLMALFAGFYIYMMGRQSLTPYNDPYFAKALAWTDE